MNNLAKAELSTFNGERIVSTGQVDAWAVTKSEDQPVSGVTFALENDIDLTISEEQLALLGYVPA